MPNHIYGDCSPGGSNRDAATGHVWEGMTFERDCEGAENKTTHRKARRGQRVTNKPRQQGKPSQRQQISMTVRGWGSLISEMPPLAHPRGDGHSHTDPAIPLPGKLPFCTCVTGDDSKHTPSNSKSPEVNQGYRWKNQLINYGTINIIEQSPWIHQSRAQQVTLL